MKNEQIAPSRSVAAVAFTCVLGGCLFLGACVSGVKVAGSGAGMAGGEEQMIVGSTTRAEILAEHPEWVDELVRSEPDEAEARRLADPAAGMEVVVFFGDWCSDSKRELARLWRAVEMAGGDFGFPIRYVGVDRTLTEPADLLEGVELLYVPTLVVSKNGIESGRIIESAPSGIERDLVALLSGETSGWISGRDDLGTEHAGGPVAATTP